MILGIVEHDRGTLNPLSLQILTFARELASQRGVPCHALVIGGAAKPLADVAGEYGASAVHVAEHERLNDYDAEAWAQCVAELTESTHPEMIVAAGTDRGNEVMAHLAARLDLPFAANCIEVPAASGPAESLRLTRMRWGGSLLEEAMLAGSIKLLTLAPHAVTAEPAVPSSSPEIVAFAPNLEGPESRVRLVGRVEPERNRISLADARVVVGGGRGVGSAEGFAALQEMADLLGGTVGCSRAVTSLGWRPHSDQVGQTGTRIAADVYIACGISGAIQHMVGCKSAKCVVAINKDPDAPIMSLADYAVVGDLQTVLPALNAEIRKAKGSP